MTLISPILLLVCQTLIIGFGALVHGAIGIGFPMIATPLLAMITDVKSAVLILVLPTVVINLASMLKGGEWQKSIARYWPLAVYGMAGSLLGTSLLVRISPDFFRPLLALVLILYLNADRLGMGFPWISEKPGLSTAVFGLAAGFLGGTVNVMLPALIIFALEIKMEKTVMIQVFNLCFLLGKLTQGLVFVIAGQMTMTIVYQSLPLAIGALAVMMLGMKLQHRIQGETYRKWLKRLLMAMAAILVIQSFTC